MRSVIITYRRLLVVVVHLLLWSGALLLALLLRFDFVITGEYWGKFPYWLAILLAVRAVAHAYARMFSGMWRYTGIRDVVTLFNATTVSSIAFALCVQLVGPSGFPRSLFVIEWLLSMALVGGLRLGIRALRELVLQGAPTVGSTRRRMLVVGAGDAGEMLVREIRGKFVNRWDVVGFIDDARGKQGERIHGVPVLGRVDDVPALVETHEVDEVVIAIPSSSARQMRHVVETCSRSKAQVRTLPPMEGLIDGRVHVNAIRDVAIEDLLGRDPVVLETDAIEKAVKGRCVVVTGAGGSIGSELCRQICAFGPARLVLIEQAENSLFHVHRHLLAAHPEVELVPYVADICDERRIATIFAMERPAMLFHAAAHKHVPMMEANPGEAIKNNVYGTKNLVDLADAHHIERFVMISTDKAVNPTSIMGASKRAAELYVQSMSQRSSTQFITVRFGNVLGSAGSVIPLFQEMITKGGPVFVTHPEMKRYFMTIPEAAQLVVQAGTIGSGGEIFVLDMGEPVKIVDLARDLIKLSGLREDDIEIKFTGLRPGEKLFEEIALGEEAVDRTRHPKIYVGRLQPIGFEQLARRMRELRSLADEGSPDQIRDAFIALIPEFQPNGRRREPVPAEPVEAEVPERISGSLLN